MTLTQEQIAALPGLVAEATPGPWVQSHRRGHDEMYRTQVYREDDADNSICTLHWHSIPITNGYRTDRGENAALIALAPDLAATVIEQQRIIAQLSEDASRAAGLALEVERLTAENADLKNSVVTFCAPWAVRYAEDHGMPEGHLHPTHYDILANAGARMAHFTRAALGGKP